MSIKEKIKNKARAALGIPKMEEEIRTLHYFLDELGDIENFPKATGALRQLQLCDTALLKVLDAIFNKYDLKYFLWCGTLLGGVRHKGFIPWDDDLDIIMPRESYERAVPILREECERLGLRFYVSAIKFFETIGIGFESGSWCDIFVLDSFKGTDDFDAVQKELETVRRKLSKYASNMDLSWEDIVSYQRVLIQKYVTPGNKLYYYRSSPRMNRIRLYQEEWMFPVRRDSFEDILLCYPHDSDALLKLIYGDYMGYPKSGVCHHGTANVASAGDPVATLEKLTAIYRELTSSQE